MSLSPQRQIAAIRKDAREYIRKREATDPAGGGNFHVPFWSDCKDHVFERGHLPDLSKGRVAANSRRQRLYPELSNGFLVWWASERSKFNQDVREIPEQVRGECGFVDIGGVIRVENLLTFRVGGVRRRFVYPYFSEIPVLSTDAARLGLAIVSTALSKFDPQVIQILDVLRSREFRYRTADMTGNELDLVQNEYGRILKIWQGFVDEFD